MMGMNVLSYSQKGIPYVPEHTADDVAGSLPIRLVLSGIGMALFTTSVITSVTIKMSNYPEV